jgi:rod shape-determining protein MreC
MALSRRSGRSRFTLALLILTSITVLTLDFRGSSAIRSMRDGASSAFSPVQDAADHVFSPLSDGWNGLFHYGNVRQDNDRLRAEVETLKGQAAQNADAQQQLAARNALDGVTAFTALPTVTAQVIAGPLTNFEHTIELDRGTANGVQVGMPVVTGAGLVGRVVSVQSNRSVIKLLTDPDVVVGIRLVSSQEAGLLHGQGDGKPLVIDADIGPKVVVAPNEVVTTSGEDRAIFPPSIPIGTVSKAELSADQLTQVLTVAPLADLSKLAVVKIIIWTPPA